MNLSCVRVGLLWQGIPWPNFNCQSLIYLSCNLQQICLLQAHIDFKKKLFFIETNQGSLVVSRPSLMELHQLEKYTHSQSVTSHCLNFRTNHDIKINYLLKNSKKKFLNILGALSLKTIFFFKIIQTLFIINNGVCRAGLGFA